MGSGAALVSSRDSLLPAYCELPRSPTHRDRERYARALAVAGFRMVAVESRVSLEFVCRRGWEAYGYARLGDFAREQLGRSGRWARDLGDLGAGLVRLPGLDEALVGADGGAPLGRVAARCVARTASSETLSEWVGVARGLPVRELLEAARRARRAGHGRPLGEALPGSPGPASERRAASPPVAEFEPTGSVDTDEADELLSEVRLVLPVPVDVAVDEVRDLHRAVSGQESSLAAFVEALVGEACAGPHPPDATLVTLGSGLPIAAREEFLARVTDRWGFLDAQGEWRAHTDGAGETRPSDATRSEASGEASSESSSEPHDAHHAARPLAVTLQEEDEASLAALGQRIEQVLERVAELESIAQTGAGPTPAATGPDRVSTCASQLRELVELENTIERLLGRVLHAMSRHGDWSQLGFAGVGHYAEQRLGMARRTAECRAGIVGALAGLPAARAAYESGAIGLESAWLLVRALGRGPVDPEIESAWVRRAREVTVKRLRDEVRRARWESSGANAPPPPLELDALPTSAFEPEVCPRSQRPVVPPAATDAAWQASLRRWPGRSRERVWRLGTRALRVPDAVVFRRFRLPQDLAAAFLAAIESERQRLEHQAESVPWPEPWPDPQAPPSVLAAHEFANRLRRLPAWVGLLSLLEDCARTWDDPDAMPDRRWKKTYERDSYRCMAPGCTACCGIEDHHIDYRSDLGSDELWNQLSLCHFHHHHGEHGGLARVRGTAPLAVTWRLGRPDLASWWRNERRLDPKTELLPEPQQPRPQQLQPRPLEPQPFEPQPPEPHPPELEPPQQGHEAYAHNRSRKRWDAERLMGMKVEGRTSNDAAARPSHQ